MVCLKCLVRNTFIWGCSRVIVNDKDMKYVMVSILIRIEEYKLTATYIVTPFNYGEVCGAIRKATVIINYALSYEQLVL